MLPGVGAEGLCRSCSRASSVCYKIDFAEFSNQAGESCHSSAGDSRRGGEGDRQLELVFSLLVPVTESAGSGGVSMGTKVEEPYLEHLLESAKQASSSVFTKVNLNNFLLYQRCFHQPLMHFLDSLISVRICRHSLNTLYSIIQVYLFPLF